MIPRETYRAIGAITMPAPQLWGLFAIDISIVSCVDLVHRGSMNVLVPYWGEIDGSSASRKTCHTSREIRKVGALIVSVCLIGSVAAGVRRLAASPAAAASTIDGSVPAPSFRVTRSGRGRCRPKSNSGTAVRSLARPRLPAGGSLASASFGNSTSRSATFASARASTPGFVCRPSSAGRAGRHRRVELLDLSVERRSGGFSDVQHRSGPDPRHPP